MAFAIVENIRGFFTSRPPLVVFMICLGAFAIVLITFAYVIKVKDMPNPDITEDWNTFLERLSKLNFCVLSDMEESISNVSRSSISDQQYVGSLLKNIPSKLNSLADKSKSELLLQSTTQSATTVSTVGTDQLVNVSMRLDVDLYPPVLGNLMRSANGNFTFLSTILHGDQLGFSAGNRREIEANLSILLPVPINLTRCQYGPCYHLRACVSITAPVQLFPFTKRPHMDEMCMRDLDVWGDSHLHLEANQKMWNSCRNTSMLTLYHQFDPTLTVMLTMQDRSVINLHLMHTSYFLFVMIVTLFCYAIIKGRHTKHKVVYTQVQEKMLSQQ